jgi:hypothetical protein
MSDEQCYEAIGDKYQVSLTSLRRWLQRFLGQAPEELAVIEDSSGSRLSPLEHLQCIKEYYDEQERGAGSTPLSPPRRAAAGSAAPDFNPPHTPETAAAGKHFSHAGYHHHDGAPASQAAGGGQIGQQQVGTEAQVKMMGLDEFA